MPTINLTSMTKKRPSAWTSIVIPDFPDRPSAEAHLTKLIRPSRFFILQVGFTDPRYIIVPKCAYPFIIGVT